MAEEKKKRGSTTDIVREIAQPLAAELGLTLWDVTFTKEGAEWYLRVFIDKPEGISIDDCVNMTHAINPVLDKEDPISQEYMLEVSSPGLERDIKTPEHIAYCTGETVEARLFAPLQGSRVHRGVLEGLDEEGNVLLAVGENTLSIPRSAISRMTTVFEF